MSQEITFEYARQYYLDRIQELRNQLPFCDPFVFSGAFIMLRLMATVSDRSVTALLAGINRIPFAEAELIERAGNRMLQFLVPNSTFSDRRVHLTHKPDRLHHLDINSDGDVLLVAADFLDDVEEVIRHVMKEETPALMKRVKGAGLLGIVEFNKPADVVLTPDQVNALLAVAKLGTLSVNQVRCMLPGVPPLDNEKGGQIFKELNQING